MLGGAADAVGFDGGAEFETQAHRLGYLGRPAELIAVDLAVGYLGKVIGAGHRSRQCRPLGLEFEHARSVTRRRLDGDIPLTFHHMHHLRRALCTVMRSLSTMA